MQVCFFFLMLFYFSQRCMVFLGRTVPRKGAEPFDAVHRDAAQPGAGGCPPKGANHRKGAV